MEPDRRQWFHLIITTYGSWLPGDPRGFRTWRHREHVEGNYKNPPPKGKYEERHEQNKKLLKEEPVIIPPEWRSIIGIALKQKLESLGAQLIAISVSGQHSHFQVKVPASQTRLWRGSAKKHSWFECRNRGWLGHLWAAGGKAVQIRDRRHQENVFRYIVNHKDEGAWVWTFRDPPC
jgi:hypothetical protein